LAHWLPGGRTRHPTFLDVRELAYLKHVNGVYLPAGYSPWIAAYGHTITARLVARIKEQLPSDAYWAFQIDHLIESCSVPYGRARVRNELSRNRSAKLLDSFGIFALNLAWF